MKLLASVFSGNPAQNIRQAVLFMFIATFAFSLYDATGKWLTAGYTAWQILLLNRLLPFLWMGRVIYQQGAKATLSTWRLHVFRGLAVWGTAAAFFFSVTYIPLAQGVVICFLAPVFIVVMAKPILKEETSPLVWLALVLGLVGCWIVGFSDFGQITWASMLALLAAILYAISILLLRLLPASQGNSQVLFYNNLIALLASLPLAIIYWQPPNLIDFLLFLTMGGIGFFAQYFVNLAYRGGPTTIIAPIEYMALPYAVILGFLLWGDVPRLTDWVGTGLILLANIVTTRTRSSSSNKTSHPVIETEH